MSESQVNSTGPFIFLGSNVAFGDFTGRGTDLNVWNQPLKEGEMRSITIDCSGSFMPTSGLVLDWTKFIEKFSKVAKEFKMSEELCWNASGKI